MPQHAHAMFYLLVRLLMEKGCLATSHTWIRAGLLWMVTSGEGHRSRVELLGWMSVLFKSQQSFCMAAVSFTSLKRWVRTLLSVTLLGY